MSSKSASTIKCAICEQPMWEGVQGKSKCLPCRRKPKPPPPSKLCAECGVEIPRRRRYCDPCRDEVRGGSWSRKTITPAAIERRKQYRSPEHRAARAKVLALVESGEAFCWRCGQHIPPGSPVHAGHDDEDRSVYRGAECPDCNLRAAARKGRAMQGKARTFLQRAAASVTPVEKPCDGCTRVFITRWPDQKYCDAACLKATRARRKAQRNQKPEPVPRPCAHCGVEFTHPNVQAKYCDKHRVYRYQPRPPHWITCAECGDRCQRKGTAKYCSKRCQRRVARRNPAEKARRAESQRRRKARRRAERTPKGVSNL